MTAALQLQVTRALHRAQEQGLIRHAFVARFDAVSMDTLAFVADQSTWQSENAWFDLASLTKGICTAPLVLQAVAEGKLSLTFEIGERFAGARARGGRMLLWHLLCHCGGLRPYDHDLPREHGHRLGTPAERSAFVAQRLAQWIQDAPGAATLYSDLGYATLGTLLEDVYGVGLDRIFARWTERLCSGLHLAFASELPLSADLAHHVPNGAGAWQVHDPMADYLGGVAGHAGLWGTGPSVVRWVQCLMTQVFELWTPQIAQLYLAKPSFFEQGTFTLGLDTATPPSTAGVQYPADVVGHLGFTGCSFWYSPSRQTGSVLLTDRAAQFPAGELSQVPAANRAALFSLRQAVHGACWM